MARIHRRPMGWQAVKPLNELTDAELSECFAVEVAGMFVHREGEIAYTSWDKNPDFEKRNQRCSPLVPPFSTSADAVLPWLGKQPWSADGEPESVKISIFDDFGNALSEGTATTFARAACIALIEQKRRDWK